MKVADMPAFPHFDWLTVRVASGRESCPRCGCAPRSAFFQRDGTYALWCANDHRWLAVAGDAVDATERE